MVSVFLQLDIDAYCLENAHKTSDSSHALSL